MRQKRQQTNIIYGWQVVIKFVSLFCQKRTCVIEAQAMNVMFIFMNHVSIQRAYIKLLL